MAFLTNIELVKKAKWVATLPSLYVNAAWGAPMTAANKARYVTNSKNAYNHEHAVQIMAAQPSTFGWDCCGLYKGICWGFTGDTSKANGGAQYKSNGVPDLNDSGFRKACKISTDWQKIVPGALVFMAGHMGIYAGDGLAIEATPKWANGVQYSAVGNIGKKAGYNTRTWECWGLSPYTEYVKDEPPKDELPTVTIKNAQSGDLVPLIGFIKDGRTYAQLSDLAAKGFMQPLGWDGAHPILTPIEK